MCPRPLLTGSAKWFVMSILVVDDDTGTRERLARILSTAGNPRIHKMSEILNLRFHEPGLTLTSVAREVGVTPEHLCRLSRRVTGTGFTAHMRRTRVAAAQQLLRATMCSVKEIAFRVGFTSVSRFDRDFKLLCGVPPTVYRRTAVTVTPARE